MSKGFLGGALVGLLVSFGFLVILSSLVPPRNLVQPEPVETAPPEETPAEKTVPEPTRTGGVVSEVDLPTGSGFGQVPSEEGTDDPAAAESSYDTPLANTESAAVPTVNDMLDGSAGAAALDQNGAPDVTLNTDPALPSPAVVAPQTPQTPPTPSLPEQPALPDAPAQPAEEPSFSAPQTPGTEDQSQLNLPSQDSTDDAVARAEPAIAVTREEADLDSGPKPQVKINRLPTIGTDAEEATEVETSEDIAPEVAPAPTRALEVNREQVTLQEGKPLMSIVLRDVGGGGVALDAWKDVRLPITFALDPSQPDVAEQAQAYRDAGYEVVLLATGLPEGASDSDLETAMEQYMQDVPVAVAVMPDILAPQPLARPLMSRLVDLAATSGHGVLTGASGLLTLQEDQTPVVPIARILDAGEEDAATQRRLMNRAVFDASQNGQAVVYAHTYPWTFVTLMEWGLSGSNGAAQMVPLSAILMAGE